jgi:hypothetical protein
VLAIVNDDMPLSDVAYQGFAGHELPLQPRVDPGVNPYVSYDSRLAWAAYAEANGIDAARRETIVVELDDAVRRVAGVGFVPTPFGRSDALSDALGFVDGGGVWVKDETGGVAAARRPVTCSRSCCTSWSPNGSVTWSIVRPWQLRHAAMQPSPPPRWRAQPTGRSTCTCRPG